MSLPIWIRSELLKTRATMFNNHFFFFSKSRASVMIKSECPNVTNQSPDKSNQTFLERPGNVDSPLTLIVLGKISRKEWQNIPNVTSRLIRLNDVTDAKYAIYLSINLQRYLIR